MVIFVLLVLGALFWFFYYRRIKGGSVKKKESPPSIPIEEFKEKIRKYIVRKMKESPDEYFSFDETSYRLGIDKDIVQETFKNFEKEKRINIKYEYDIQLWHRFLTMPVYPEFWFRINVLDEGWFEK